MVMVVRQRMTCIRSLPRQFWKSRDNLCRPDTAWGTLQGIRDKLLDPDALTRPSWVVPLRAELSVPSREITQPRQRTKGPAELGIIL